MNIVVRWIRSLEAHTALAEDSCSTPVTPVSPALENTTLSHDQLRHMHSLAHFHNNT